MRTSVHVGICAVIVALITGASALYSRADTRPGAEAPATQRPKADAGKTAFGLPPPFWGSGTPVIHDIQAKNDASRHWRGRRKRRLSRPVKPIIGPTMRRMDPSVAAAPRVLLSNINSWAYQLSEISPPDIRSCRVDVAVIDYSVDGTLRGAFTREQVEAMRTKPDGGKTKIIAYMSIGEAEDYRDLYWKSEWLSQSSRRPKWLGPANDEGWSNNYRVRYWDPEWQKLILGSPDAYLDRLIASGFDGVYLDIVDGFEFWQDPRRSPDGGNKSAADDMIQFVSRIARYAWSKNPNFYVIPQNGEALLESDVFRAHISAIGIEDLYFGWSNQGDSGSDDVEPLPASETNERMVYLQKAMQQDIPVLAVEYLMDQTDDQRLVGEVDARMRKRGLIPHFAERQLGHLSCPRGAVQSSARTGQRLLAVDWKDPEIAAFPSQREDRALQSFTTGDESILSRIRLPVLAFDRPPGLIGRAFAAQSQPERKRQILTDPDNPVWYTIVEQFGGLTVTIDGDLRVQTVLPAGTAVAPPAAPSLAAGADITVIDDKVEEGMEGLAAEYTVRKFPDIPYRVSIECTRATKQFCTDKQALARDREGLQIVSVRPPQ